MAIGIVAAMLGAGTFAYFSDTEISTGNTFTTGTLVFELYPASAVWTLPDMKPNHFVMNRVELRNTGLNDGNHVEIQVDNSMSDPVAEESDTNPGAAAQTGTGELMDTFMELIELGYHSHARVQAILDAADLLVSTQNGDGGWPWTVPGVSTTNTLGACGQGVAAGYYLNPDNAGYLASLDAAYQYALGDPNVDSGPDIYFLEIVSELTNDPKYAELAKDRYDSKITSYGSATALAEGIRDLRHSQGIDGLIPWDIKLWVEGALALSIYFCGEQAQYYQDAVDMAEVVYQDMIGNPGYFDEEDPNEAYYELGLCGGIQCFTLTGTHLTGTPSAESLKTTLIGLQNGDGSWDGSNGDYQDTAYAVMSLMVYASYGQIKGLSGIAGAVSAAQAGADWLVANQDAGGGWPYSGTDYPEVDGECAVAIFLAGSLLYRITDSNANDWYDLDDFENLNEDDPVDLDDITPPPPASGNSRVTMKLRFNPNAGNGMQGDVVDMTMTFNLLQHLSQ